MPISDQFDFLAETDELSRRPARSQNEIVRDYLMANPNRWIAMPVLAKMITQTGVGTAVHSRIHNCRQFYGMTITNRVSRKAGRSKSWYMYEPVQLAT